MNTIFQSQYTAFVGDRLLARGTYTDVAQALGSAGPSTASVLVFDDATGAPVDTPPPPEYAARWSQVSAAKASAAATASTDNTPRPSPGRPRLGVVAREVTLLPRHWQWLSAQTGGASATLRRLVEQAKKSNEHHDTVRQSRDICYKFMSAIAGHHPGYEEATRALFAGDRHRFEALIATWPRDVAGHLHQLAAPSWIESHTTP